MTKIQHITSLDDPGLAPYRSLRRPEEHVREGIFVAEGEKVVRRLLATRFTVHSLLMTHEWYKRLEDDIDCKAREVGIVYVGERKLLEAIVGFNLHQGIMAVAAMPPESEIDHVLANAPSPRLFIALDNLVSAENVGVVVRNCAAFGVQALLVGATSSSPYLRRAVRNSMGTVFTLPVIHTPDLSAVLRRLRTECGFHVVATQPRGSRSVSGTDFSGDVVIILGNEGTGVSAPILEECTSRVAIPMSNGTDSLNVGSASAVFLYEVQRQRTGSRAAGETA